MVLYPKHFSFNEQFSQIVYLLHYMKSLLKVIINFETAATATHAMLDLFVLIYKNT